MKRLFKHLLLACVLAVSTTAWAQMPYNTNMTQTHYNNSSIIVESSRASWSSGVELKGGNFNWDDKYIIIALNQQSIPYQ